jgi:hypothetical protein
MNIHVRCFTNLDDYSREIWPTEMCVRPMIGDRVAAASGRTLKVVRVDHCMTNLRPPDGRSTPYLVVELHH